MKTFHTYRIILICALFCFGLSAIAFGWLLVRWWQGVSIELWAQVFALVFGLLSVSIGGMLVYRRNSLILPERNSLILFLVIMMLCFIGSEYILRAWLIYSASEDRFGVYATYNMIKKRPLRYTSHPYLPFALTPSYTNKEGDRHNSLGFRGEEIILPKPEGTFRIVTIGGSTTYTAEVKTYKESYPYQLEQELRARGFTHVEVINAGVPFYDSWSIFVNLAFRVFDLDPDLIVYYEGDNEFKTHLVYPFEAFRGDNTGRVHAYREPTPTIIDHFVLTRMIFKPFGLTSDFNHLGALYDAQTLFYDEYLEQLRTHTYPSGIFVEHPVESFFEHNDQSYSKRNIEQMVELSKVRNIRFMIASYAYAPLGIRATTPVYQKFVFDFNSLLRDVAKKQGALFFDFAAHMSTDERYWVRDGVHVNAKGAQLKGKLFADFLEPLLKRYGAR
ncbi:MAG: SGNH/GDSL hydrolase family protein [Patescibacteria group bacterium]